MASGTIKSVVPRSDIVNNLTTNDSTKVLSAAQGKALNDKVAKVVNATSYAYNSAEAMAAAYAAIPEGDQGIVCLNCKNNQVLQCAVTHYSSNWGSIIAHGNDAVPAIYAYLNSGTWVIKNIITNDVTDDINNCIVCQQTNDIIASALAITDGAFHAFRGSGSSYTGSIPTNSGIGYGSFSVLCRSSLRFITAISNTNKTWTNVYNGASWTGWHSTDSDVDTLNSKISTQTITPSTPSDAVYTANIYKAGNVVCGYVNVSDIGTGTVTLNMPSDVSPPVNMRIPVFNDSGVQVSYCLMRSNGNVSCHGNGIFSFSYCV